MSFANDTDYAHSHYGAQRSNLATRLFTKLKLLVIHESATAPTETRRYARAVRMAILAVGIALPWLAILWFVGLI